MLPPDWLTVIRLWIDEVTPLCILLTAILWNPLKQLWNKHVVEPDSKQDKRLNNIDEILQDINFKLDSNAEVNIMLLHTHLYRLCKDTLAKGYLTEGTCSELKQLYNAYHDIGGNGTAEKLYSECMKLDLRYEN